MSCIRYLSPVFRRTQFAFSSVIRNEPTLAPRTSKICQYSVCPRNLWSHYGLLLLRLNVPPKVTCYVGEHNFHTPHNFESKYPPFVAELIIYSRIKRQILGDTTRLTCFSIDSEGCRYSLGGVTKPSIFVEIVQVQPDSSHHYQPPNPSA